MILLHIEKQKFFLKKSTIKKGRSKWQTDFPEIVIKQH
jgi:hypothetical protein